jgi:hypothetical protein
MDKSHDDIEHSSQQMLENGLKNDMAEEEHADGLKHPRQSVRDTVEL